MCRLEGKSMTLDNYYLHAIEPYGERNPFDIELALDKLEKVISSGYILSRRQRGDTKKSIGGWNGIDYISLCDYSKRNNPPYNNDERFKDYTAYNNYIKDSVSLIKSSVEDASRFNANLIHTSDKHPIRDIVYEEIRNKGYKKVAETVFRSTDYYKLKLLHTLLNTTAWKLVRPLFKR